MQFYLGTHHPSWLWSPDARFPLFVSHRALARVKRLRPATGPWALDSGGFTELSKFGEWRTSPAEYVEAVARYDREIGHLDWAAPQDWMCEPESSTGAGRQLPRNRAQRGGAPAPHRGQLPGAGRAVAGRQRPAVPVHPGHPGLDARRLRRCAELYAEAGVRLADREAVGLGSVCRRQNTIRIGAIVGLFADELPIHGFGVKTQGLAAYGSQLASADSLAWSLDARRSDPLPGHTHKSCANCLEYAASWRTDLLDRIEYRGLAA